jgi:Lyase
MDPLMDQYNESLSFDRVFYAQDIKGSIAYARANVKAGILTQEEFEKLDEGLKKVLKEWDEGKFQPAPGDEGEQAPVHMPFVLPPRWSLSRCHSSGVWIHQTSRRGYQVGSDVTKFPFPEINC